MALFLVCFSVDTCATHSPGLKEREREQCTWQKEKRLSGTKSGVIVRRGEERGGEEREDRMC